MSAFLLFALSSARASEERTEVVDFNEQGYGSGTTITSYAGQEFYITFSHAAYYENGAALRCYAGSNITVASNTRFIEKIILTFSETDGNNQITVNVGSFEDNIWIGNSPIITFTIASEGTASIKQRRLINVFVQYAENTTFAHYAIRLNPYTWSYDDAYLSVWTGSSSSNSGFFLGDPIDATINKEDGWFMATIDIPEGLPFYIGWSNFASGNTRFTCSAPLTESACFEASTNSIEQVDYYKIDETIYTYRLNKYSISADNVGFYLSEDGVSWGTPDWKFWENSEDKDGWYEVAFRSLSGSSWYVGWGSMSSYTGNKPSYISDVKFSESACFEVVNDKLQVTECRKLDDTEYTVRFDSYSVDWTDVYLYVWKGSRDYDKSSLFEKIVPAQKMTLSKDGWWTYSFNAPGDLNFRVGFSGQEKSKPEYNTADFYSESNCFEYINKLEMVSCASILPDETNSFTVHVSIPGTLEQTLQQVLGDLSINKIVSLTITGSINDDDVALFSQMNHLQKLDISQTDVTEFGGCKDLSRLDKVLLPSTCQRINDYAFQNCKHLTHIDYPVSLTYIGKEALPYVNNVELPDGVLSVGEKNFQTAQNISIPSTVITWNSYSQSWTNVYCYRATPQSFNVFKNGEGLENDTLHVYAFCIQDYRISEYWSRFGTIVVNEKESENITVNNDLTITTTEGIADKCNLFITEDGALLVDNVSQPLHMGSYTQMMCGGDRAYYELSKVIDGTKIPYYGMYIPYIGVLYLNNSSMMADDVSIKYVPIPDRWNFFSLPFDVCMKDIRLETQAVENVGISQWVIREYSGANRAYGEGDTWKDMSANDTLKAHTGYILYWTVTNNSEHDNNMMTSAQRVKRLYYFHMPAVENDKQQNLFIEDDIDVPLTEYIAEFPHNSNWNLTGNPYPCAYDIRWMEFNAPITTWDGNKYVAYSLEDDNYILRPSEAFFVQAPQGTTKITFSANGRMTSNVIVVTEEEYNNHQIYYMPPKRMSIHSSVRKVFNFILSNEDYSDRARLVLNDQALAAYEITRDAAKMMSSDMSVPQLFVNDNGLRYAIDERPEASSYVLGAFFGKSGDYTIHLNLPQNEERKVLITDTETNTTTDLTMTDYTFTTKSGTYSSRFVISFAPQMPTGIEETSLMAPKKTMENGHMIINTPQGTKYTVGGIEL